MRCGVLGSVEKVEKFSSLGVTKEEVITKVFVYFIWLIVQVLSLLTGTNWLVRQLLAWVGVFQSLEPPRHFGVAIGE